MNALTREMAGLFEKRLLDEKWVFAPSYRVGFQWLDRIAAAGRPVVNARIQNFRHLAIEAAAPVLSRDGFKHLGALETDLVIARLFEKLPKKDPYLSELKPGPGLYAALRRAISDLRLAGIASGGLKTDAFEASAKGREIAQLLRAYEKELTTARLADYPMLLDAAIKGSREKPILPDGAIAIVPRDDIENMNQLERRLWETIPKASRFEIECDRRESRLAAEQTDASALCHIDDPTKAPPPKDDGTADIFRAVGEVNEAREVFRRCAEKRIQFDDVEVLYTDGSTYVPLFFELSASLKGDIDDLPVTFMEGVPVRYSRPGRALKAWAAWIREDRPQWILAGMIEDGLIELGNIDMGFSRLAAAFRTAPIGVGSANYIDALDGLIESYRKKAAGKRSPRAPDDPLPDRIDKAQAAVDALGALKQAIVDLLEAPDNGADAKMLECAARMLETRFRSVNQLDEYAKRRLIDEIRGLSDFVEDGDYPGMDYLDWLDRLPDGTSVGALGPRPGKLYVAPIALGGHSGRRHTFIVGLDDRRFPGAGAQDPIILDEERGRISDALSTSDRSRAKKTDDLLRLLARLRGNVTMSYTGRDVADDRETFPCHALLAAYRILSGNRDGIQADLDRWLGSNEKTVSFTPRSAERSLDANEWWLWRLDGVEASPEIEKAVAKFFPHLANGFAARDARASSAFTEYDGLVPEAGRDLDPTAKGARPMSSSALEEMARCPLQYFFHRVLGVKPPEEYVHDPDVWLDAIQKGSLLHEVFNEFMRGLSDKGLSPVEKRDRDALFAIFDREVESWRKLVPPPDDIVFNREVEDMRETVAVFLRDEERHCDDFTPMYFEVGIGPKSYGERSPIDVEEPIPFPFPGGSIMLTGRVDRIDRVRDAGERFVVWDYKTGRGKYYSKADPFKQGRHIQCAVYPALATAALRKKHAKAEVERFGYFFPGAGEYGKRIDWSADELEDGKAIVAKIVESIRTGCFPMTDDIGDLKISDHGPAFVDADKAVADASRKLDDPANEALKPFRDLRGSGDESEDGE